MIDWAPARVPEQFVRLALVAAAALLLVPMAASAQRAGASRRSPAAVENAAASPSTGPDVTRWATQCVGESRQMPPDCSIQQSAIVTSTGQLLASLTVRVPHDTRAPELLFQVPVGLYLPGGIAYAIDDSQKQVAALQTCDANGCYAETPLTAENLAAMKSGKRFAVSFENLAKKDIVIPFVLDGFAEGYPKIQ